ncbi:MAG: hypothetical protein OER22_01335 [Gammaproteobacteria bacterium]|nr:hypothetical protein [Gammaproteobacteria bacterium]MDH3373682.1 hypothetical protein [Gammaproteobacteria bacterium]MDH3408035.1 hypothetical protein [Gammaproteobacteria bacterium]MDH3551235.1 hypothetical protein [Gammaproteobacteria bacterium]
MRRKLRLATILLVLAPVTTVIGQTSTTFARVSTDENDQPKALQLAIATYVPQDREQVLSVDLISAIHIGDSSYYAELNQRFKKYDALLYELVAPENAAVSNRLAKRKGFISSAQIGMTKLLDLSFQLDEINYDQANFVHADLSPQELRDSMDDRGESLYVYFWRIFFASLDQYAKDPLGLKDWAMLSAVLSSDQDDALKTMIAYEMTNIEQVRDIFGEDSDSAVIGARNQRAVDVLKREVEAGARHIGIFYGVAHMPDLEERLLDQLGLTYDRTNWVDAWRLGSDTKNSAP